MDFGVAASMPQSDVGCCFCCCNSAILRCGFWFVVAATMPQSDCGLVVVLMRQCHSQMLGLCFFAETRPSSDFWDCGCAFAETLA